jgi:hypothetical protein
MRAGPDQEFALGVCSSLRGAAFFDESGICVHRFSTKRFQIRSEPHRESVDAPASLEQPHELNLLGEEGIVSVVAGHFPVISLGAGLTNLPGKAAHRVGRE